MSISTDRIDLPRRRLSPLSEAVLRRVEESTTFVTLHSVFLLPSSTLSSTLSQNISFMSSSKSDTLEYPESVADDDTATTDPTKRVGDGVGRAVGEEVGSTLGTEVGVNVGLLVSSERVDTCVG